MGAIRSRLRRWHVWLGWLVGLPMLIWTVSGLVMVARPIEEVRGELEREFLESERERRYSDLAGRMVDALYRDPTSLAAAAKEVNLEVQTLGPFGRVGGADPLSADPKVLASAFSPGMIAERHVSDALEVGEGRLVAIRVTDHAPPAPIPLAEIREQVAQEYAASRRSERLR